MSPKETLSIILVVGMAGMLMGWLFEPRRVAVNSGVSAAMLPPTCMDADMRGVVEDRQVGIYRCVANHWVRLLRVPLQES